MNHWFYPNGPTILDSLTLNHVIGRTCIFNWTSMLCYQCVIPLEKESNQVYESVCISICPAFWRVRTNVIATYSELRQRHEAYEVVPHTADVLQLLLQLLRAHRRGLDAQLHTPRDAIHFHHAWEGENKRTHVTETHFLSRYWALSRDVLATRLIKSRETVKQQDLVRRGRDKPSHQSSS